MVNVTYTKEVGLKQQSGSAGFTIPASIPITRPVNQEVSGNSIAALDFGALVHGTGNQNANNIDLNGKYIRFRSITGDFYAWFNIDGNGSDPQLSGQPIVIDGGAASVNQANEIVALLLSKLNANAGFTEEFAVTATDPSILEVCARRLGDVSGIVSDITSLQSIQDNAGNPVSVGLSETKGTGYYLIGGTGLSKVGGASSKADGGAFVVLKNLKQDANYGVKKIILISSHPANVQIRTEANTDLGTLDAAGEAMQLIWNGTTWKVIYSS